MNKKGLLVVVIIIIIIVVAGIYVKFGDIKGESDDNGSSQRSRGDTTLGDVVVTKESDRSSDNSGTAQPGVSPADVEPGDDMSDGEAVDPGEENVGSGTSDGSEGEDPDVIEPLEVSITYSDNGFEPTKITINIGDTVTYVNESSLDMWPASDVHPTHTAYPESDIKKCFDGSDTSLLFDSCGSVATYSFTFTEIGEWEYHNHKESSHGGMIIVQ